MTREAGAVLTLLRVEEGIRARALNKTRGNASGSARIAVSTLVKPSALHSHAHSAAVSQGRETVWYMLKRSLVGLALRQAVVLLPAQAR